MKKQFITGFLSGALIFGVVGALAATYTATDNPFPVKLNGNDVQIEGYNIEGSTYFKLRDIADTVGGFEVGFQNDIIQLSKDGYVYEDKLKQPFVEKYTIDDLLKNTVQYDLDGDGNEDTLSINAYSAYEATNDTNLQGFARYEFVINGISYFIGDMRHGRYEEVFVTDIDQTDGFLDIALIHVYKGKSASIYRFDGNNIIGFSCINDNEYTTGSNLFSVWNSYWDTVNNSGDINPTTSMNVNDSNSGTIGFSFSCGGEYYSYIKEANTDYRQQ